MLLPPQSRAWSSSKPLVACLLVVVAVTRFADWGTHEEEPEHVFCREGCSGEREATHADVCSLEYAANVNLTDENEDFFAFAHALGQSIGSYALTMKSIGNLSTFPLLQQAQHEAMLINTFSYKIGLYHGSVWMIAGISPSLDFRLIRHELCPRGEYEFVLHCLHGYGHSGFIRGQAERKGYTACSVADNITDTAVLYEAYNHSCRHAPSTFLEFLCSNGYYHGVFEHLATPDDWKYPCVGTDLPHKSVCWVNLFLVASQSASAAGDSLLMKSRTERINKEGIRSWCRGLELEHELLCYFGMASQMHFNGFSAFVPTLASEEYGIKIRTTWEHFFPYEDNYTTLPMKDVGEDVMTACRALTSVDWNDWPRWHACISGSFDFWMPHMFRHRPVGLTERALMCDEMRRVAGQRTHTLCMKRIRIGYHSFPQVDSTSTDEYGIFPYPKEQPASWEMWWNADILDEKHKYYMAPFHPSAAIPA